MKLILHKQKGVTTAYLQLSPPVAQYDNQTRKYEPQGLLYLIRHMWLHNDETAVNFHRFMHDGLLGDINKDDIQTKKKFSC